MSELSLSDAIILATRAHEYQQDKLGQPYIRHCLRVMELAAPDLDAMVVGVLHDVLEDTNEVLTPEQLGYVPFHALQVLTRRHGESYEDYIEHLCRADGAIGKLARKVKIEDLRDNISRNTYLPAGPSRTILRARYLAARDAINARIARLG